MITILPSCDRTPSIAFKNPENVRPFIFYVFFLSVNIASTSSIKIIDFFGAVFNRRLKLKSLILSEQLTKHIEYLIQAAMAWAKELFPVPGGPQSKQLLLQGIPIQMYHSSLQMKSPISSRTDWMNSGLKITLSSFLGLFSFETFQYPWLFSQTMMLSSEVYQFPRLKTWLTNSLIFSMVYPKMQIRFKYSIILHSVVSLAQPLSSETIKSFPFQVMLQSPQQRLNSVSIFLNLFPIVALGGAFLHLNWCTFLPSSRRPLFMSNLRKILKESSSLSMTILGMA